MISYALLGMIEKVNKKIPITFEQVNHRLVVHLLKGEFILEMREDHILLTYLYISYGYTLKFYNFQTVENHIIKCYLRQKKEKQQLKIYL